MPLPTTSVTWPPKQLEQVTPVLGEWSAWWTGDPHALAGVYRGRYDAPAVRPSQRRGGVVGALSRFWWGRPVTSPGQQHDQTHVPLAADIARTSADLLFSEPPDLVVDDKPTQARLEEVLSDHLFATLTGAAEQAAALGGAYLRVTWDATISDAAFIVAVPADEAWPEFAWGRLRAVTFWHVVAEDNTTVWRHLERHELAPDGVTGLVQHGLYQGTGTDLGRPVPLQDQPATAPLAAAVDANGYVIAGRTPGLAVVYVPNCDTTTAKAWRAVPAARGWGASDFDGIEPLLDNLDEIHGSWMRDLRLAKARILVARYMLDDNGPGSGASFNLDAEVYAPLKMELEESGNAPITPQQFDIRFEEHRGTAREWTERIIRSAGYSLQTFGDWDSAQMTATEVQSRDNRSLMTRGRKLRAWRPALTALVTKLLAVDADVFGRPGNPEGLQVRFPDGIWETPLQLAQTAQAMRAAEAASTRTLVALLHPEWDEIDVDDETTRILGERGAPVRDPFAVTE